MKRISVVLVVLVVILGVSQPARAGSPCQIAGFRLGTQIKDYENRVKMDTAMPIRHMEYLSELEIKPLPGFRTGYIIYGNCKEPGQIIRVKLKYEQEDKAFFDELLSHYKKKFGEPREYKGDVFRAYIAWKWSFTDDSGRRISLILQHGSEEDSDDYPRGNTVKMTCISAMEKEQECYENKLSSSGARKSTQSAGQKKIDFKELLPE